MVSPEAALVTGGAGFIGSHLAEALLQRGHPLAIVDSLDTFYAHGQKRANLEHLRRAGEFRFYPCDVRDRVSLLEAFERERPAVVIHLAAQVGVRHSLQWPDVYHEVNVTGTHNLLDLARSFQVRRFVFASSSSVYGSSSAVPFSEELADLKPISPYASTKLEAERLCHGCSRQHGLSIVCLRFFSVYGPRQRPDLAIHKFAALLEAGQPLPIFGDGTAGRDYTYVGDIVNGILRSLAHETPYDVFNLGNSHPVQVLELVRLLECATGRKARLEFLPAQAADMTLTWADIRKAQTLLGYEPRTSLPAGIETFLAWYRNRSWTHSATARWEDGVRCQASERPL